MLSTTEHHSLEDTAMSTTQFKIQRALQASGVLITIATKRAWAYQMAGFRSKKTWSYSFLVLGLVFSLSGILVLARSLRGILVLARSLSRGVGTLCKAEVDACNDGKIKPAGLCLGGML
jgi:hypothetical protein